MWVVGIDEAGRGSLVGELMIAAFAIEDSKESLLKKMGVRTARSSAGVSVRSSTASSLR